MSEKEYDEQMLLQKLKLTEIKLNILELELNKALEEYSL